MNICTEHPHEECGVFEIYDPAADCARTAYYGQYTLQHRGQEACGIAAINDRELSFHKDVGLVGDVFTEGAGGHHGGGPCALCHHRL